MTEIRILRQFCSFIFDLVVGFGLSPSRALHPSRTHLASHSRYELLNADYHRTWNNTAERKPRGSDGGGGEEDGALVRRRGRGCACSYLERRREGEERGRGGAGERPFLLLSSAPPYLLSSSSPRHIHAGACASGVRGRGKVVGMWNRPQRLIAPQPVAPQPVAPQPPALPREPRGPAAPAQVDRAGAAVRALQPAGRARDAARRERTR